MCSHGTSQAGTGWRATPPFWYRGSEGRSSTSAKKPGGCRKAPQRDLGQSTTPPKLHGKLAQCVVNHSQILDSQGQDCYQHRPPDLQSHMASRKNGMAAGVRLPFTLRPQPFPFSGAEKDPTFATMRAANKGIICPRCRCCLARQKLEGWYCATFGCKYEYVSPPLNINIKSISDAFAGYFDVHGVPNYEVKALSFLRLLTSCRLLTSMSHPSVMHLLVSSTAMWCPTTRLRHCPFFDCSGRMPLPILISSGILSSSKTFEDTDIRGNRLAGCGTIRLGRKCRDCHLYAHFSH